VFPRILLVEDDQCWLSAALELFASAGYAVRGARTFRHAREAMELFEPDLLVTEIRLQEHNGLHLLIRSQFDHPQMVCLIVSGSEDSVLERDARQLGAADFVVKPVDPAMLLARAADALASHRPRAWRAERTSIDPSGVVRMPPAPSESVEPRSSSTT
jgi:DNA-binding response OmpR family regulator